MHPSNKAPVGLIALISCFVTLIGLYADTFAWVWSIVTTNDDYSHGILLPFISLYLIFQRRTEIRQLASDNHPLILGALLVILSAPLFLIGKLSDSHFISWLSFFPLISGTIMLTGGTAVAALLTPPVLINLLAKPLPDSLIPSLFGFFQTVAAKGSMLILDLLQIPAYLTGNIIEIPGMTLMVEEACSGIRSVLTLITVACVLALLHRWNAILTIVMLGVATVVAVLFNIVRVACTALLALYGDKTLAEGFFHSFSGLLVFCVGFLVLYGLGNMVERLLKRRPL